MRTTLLPGLLAAVATNLARQAERVAVFEQGRVYLPRLDGRDCLRRCRGPKDTCQPWPLDEPETLGIALCGPVAGESWAGARPGRPTSSRSKASSSACWPASQIGERSASSARPSRTCTPASRPPCCSADERVGSLGLLRPDVAARYGIEDREVYVAELAVAPLAARGLTTSLFEDLLTFPPASQDLAVVLDAGVPAAEVRRRRAPGRRQAAARGRTCSTSTRATRCRAGKRSLAVRLSALARPHADRQGHHRRAPQGAQPRSNASSGAAAALGTAATATRASRRHPVAPQGVMNSSRAASVWLASFAGLA